MFVEQIIKPSNVNDRVFLIPSNNLCDKISNLFLINAKTLGFRINNTKTITPEEYNNKYEYEP